MTVTRDKLYEEVWAEPMLTVAERYGVSSSFLARVCERMNVPRPARGYWAQLKFGKAVEKSPLPEPRGGDELEWVRGRRTGRRPPRPLPKTPSSAAPSGARDDVRPAEHQLLAGARAHFDAAAVVQRGYARGYGYLKPLKKLLVDVISSREALPRALEIANQLFTELQARGHEVTFAPTDQSYHRPAVDQRERGPSNTYERDTWRPARSTLVFIGTVAIGLTIFELSEEVEVQRVGDNYVRVTEVIPPKRKTWRTANVWIHKQDMPSGRLCLRAYSPYGDAQWQQEWREATSGDLQTKILSIARALKRQAPVIAKLVEEADARAEESRKAWEIERAELERKEAERLRVEAAMKSREELLALVEDWALAKRIEGFFDDAGQRVERLDIEEARLTRERLDRARALLGGVDALGRFGRWRSPEEIFEERSPFALWSRRHS